MTGDQDGRCERTVLKGSLKAQSPLEGGLSSRVIAVVNLVIKKFTFSGSRIERVALNSTGGSHGNFRDDPSIHR